MVERSDLDAARAPEGDGFATTSVWRWEWDGEQGEVGGASDGHQGEGRGRTENPQ